MHIAFCAYDGMTALDFVGAYDPLTRLNRLDIEPVDIDVCGPSATVETSGLTLGIDRVDPELGSYDVVFVPGGTATRSLCSEPSFLDWIATADGCRYLTSVCTGSLLLGAAGLLDGYTATTHPDATDQLASFADVSTERIVHDGHVITAGGVASSIDLGLYLVETIAGPDARVTVAEHMDYPYGPPTVDERTRP